MIEHRWSGWPGAWCLDCGVADQGEICIANCERATQCVQGHEMCMDPQHPPWQCPEHRNGECPEPNSGRHDPYQTKPT